MIAQLIAKKEIIERQEKYIKLGVRIGVGLLFIWINWLFRYYYIGKFNLVTDLSKFLNVNAAVISIYTFFAFITYGSADNFVNRAKEVLKRELHKRHLYSLEELEALYNERDQLNADLDRLEGI